MDIKKTTILLVEKDTAEKENFAILTEQENWDLQSFSSSYEAIQWIKKNNGADAAVIAYNSTPLNAYQTHDYIRNELKLDSPIFISIESDNISNDDGYSYLSKPYTEQTIKKIQQHLLNTGEEDTMDKATEKVYSLSYLKTIAGDNHDFLIDCLKTFISSVSGKMTELKVAVSSNNSTDIGAIAHNIKPSFEMLENDTARDICNKLTYEAETADIPALCALLEREFIMIEAALKNDFAELK